MSGPNKDKRLRGGLQECDDEMVECLLKKGERDRLVRGGRMTLAG